MIPDLLQRRSLFMIVGHHIENERLELIRVLILALGHLYLLGLEQITTRAQSENELEEVSKEADKKVE